MSQNPEIPVVIVVGMGRKTRAIGQNNGLLWHVPDDLKRFKALTLGHPIIMGRKTFESILDILGKPLPGRTNIVITRNPAYDARGAKVVDSLESALAVATSEAPSEIHIGGGADIYRQALPHVSRIHATFYDDDISGDTHFPEFRDDFTPVTEHPLQSHKDIVYQWVDFERST